MEEEYNNLTYTPYALRAFDAVFTAALALNNSLDNLRLMNLSLEDFEFANYTKSAIFAAIIKKNIRELSFQGVLVNYLKCNFVTVTKEMFKFHYYRTM